MASEQMAIVQRSPQEVGEPLELTIDDLCRQVVKIQQVMERVMRKDEHYGTIPGCKKPSLYKAGAEKLGFTFRLAPRFSWVTTDLGNGHREHVVTCELVSMVSGRFIGSGVGSCSTMEEKYRFRGAEKVWTGSPVPKAYWDTRKTDPEKAAAMIGGKGCKALKNEDGAWEIAMLGEKQENPNIADTYNTVLKMAKKRAHIDAILTATAASDIFTQDVEDFADVPPGTPTFSTQTNAQPVNQGNSPQTPQASTSGDGNGAAQSPTAPTTGELKQQELIQAHKGKKASDKKITQQQQRELAQISGTAQWEDKEFMEMLEKEGYSSLADVPASEYERIAKRLKDGPIPF